MNMLVSMALRYPLSACLAFSSRATSSWGVGASLRRRRQGRLDVYTQGSRRATVETTAQKLAPPLVLVANAMLRCRLHHSSSLCEFVEHAGEHGEQRYGGAMAFSEQRAGAFSSRIWDHGGFQWVLVCQTPQRQGTQPLAARPGVLKLWGLVELRRNRWHSSKNARGSPGTPAATGSADGLLRRQIELKACSIHVQCTSQDEYCTTELWIMAEEEKSNRDDSSSEEIV